MWNFEAVLVGTRSLYRYEPTFWSLWPAASRLADTARILQFGEQVAAVTVAGWLGKDRNDTWSTAYPFSNAQKR